MAEIVRTEASLDDVMRYFAQGYDLTIGGREGDLIDVRYAITEGHPRRVWFQLTVREEGPTPAHDPEAPE